MKTLRALSKIVILVSGMAAFGIHLAQAATCGMPNTKSCIKLCAEVAAERCGQDPSWTAPAGEREFVALSTTPAGCCESVAQPIRGQGDWAKCGVFLPISYNASHFIADCKAALPRE
jgi:hypothetical protein